MHLLCLLRGRSASRADRPDGLVRQHRTAQRRGTRHLQHRIKLAGHHLLRPPAFTLLERFPHAQHRRNASFRCSREFRRHLDVGLPEQSTTLGMPDQHEPAAEIGEHHGGNFARIGPRCKLTDGLRTQPEGRARESC